MAYCHKCGTEIYDEAVVCPKCGVEQKGAKPAVNDSGSFGWSVLGCCIPIVGLILWLVWKDTQPNNAKKAGMGALISIILVIVFYVLMFIIGIIGSMM